jgi:hypothetical protein
MPHLLRSVLGKASEGVWIGVGIGEDAKEIEPPAAPAAGLGEGIGVLHLPLDSSTIGKKIAKQNPIPRRSTAAVNAIVPVTCGNRATFELSQKKINKCETGHNYDTQTKLDFILILHHSSIANV